MKLIGKSQKGKNRVRELGGEWLLLRKSEWDGRLLLRPVSDPTGEKDRWVHPHNDPDFICKENSND